MQTKPADVVQARAPLDDVRGKVAVITGGSSGIGLGIARACAFAGMKVLITYRTLDHLRRAQQHLAAYDAEVHAVEVDVTDRAATARAADEADRRLGPVHLLCCNAGVGVSVPIAEATFDDWDFALGVNVGGVVNTLQAFLPRMISHGQSAHVVATASMGGLFHGSRFGIYTTTKFAVVGMMEALRGEFAPRGIGVSVLCPGLVASNIFQSDRNRPSHLAGGRAPTELDARQTAHFREFMSVGMDPFECGQKVIRGVRRNDMYILTHPEFAQGLKDRCDVLLASIRSDGEEPPLARLVAEQTVLRHPVYVAEKARVMQDPDA